MSTYLACFIICDFDQLPTVTTGDGIPVTVYAQPGQAKNMLFARDLTVKALKFYTEYFGIKYTLPKLGFNLKHYLNLFLFF
jgi:glutamyl aminopeptidase